MLFKDKQTGALVEVHRVEFAQQGGGLLKSLTAEEFFKQFEPTSKQEFVACTVDADWWEDVHPVPCYSDGKRWNGWGKPYFEKEVLLQMMAEGRLDAVTYDQDADAFIAVIEDDRDVYPAQLIEVDGKQVTVYDVGAGSWCWYQCVPVTVSP